MEEIIKWNPEDFGFEPHKITNTQTREDLFYKGYFELRKLPENFWLCRKKVKNKNGNTEYLVRFYLPILSDDINIAKYLLTKGLQ